MPEVTDKDLADFKAAKEERDSMKAELEKLKVAPKTEPKPDPKPEDDKDLRDKVRLDKEAKDKEGERTKQIEGAISFNMKSGDFLKQNETLLPKEVSDIFVQADKETYSDAIEKAAALKSGLIQSFFSVQSNLDLLTAGQKSQLDDYLKLTKTGKQDKAQSIYEIVFEPAFETLKKVKKAEALSKGLGEGGDDGYKKRLMAGSKKHYLGENKNA